LHVTRLDDCLASDAQVLMGYVYILYWQVVTAWTGGQFSLIMQVIIIIITNEEIIVAFSPKTTRTRYKVKKQNREISVSIQTAVRSMLSS